MLIQSEDIQEAKDKLGDTNALIMVEELGIDDFDERNLKCCCPYHEEDTPSFIFNKKNHTFHCFGCGKTVDIIDVYMEKGKTYIEACQKLFELAEMPYSFGEANTKTKRQYKYPVEQPKNNLDNVYKYLGLRGISKKTVDYADVREDSHGNCVFNYYDTNDVLTTVKYRPTHAIKKGSPKTWCQQGADTSPLLFNMNRINTNQPLLITEGEIDCLAAIESGYQNSTSVPFGANNYSWIEENWNWLEQFESIILASDNDEAGLKMQKECIYRLGSWRCKVVDIPDTFMKPDGNIVQVSDINEMMFWYGKQAVFDAIVNAKDTPVDSVIDFSDIGEVDLSEIDGVYTGIKEFDQEMMRLFYGTFNIVTGVNGSGKSSFLLQLIAQALEQGKDAWLYSKELPNYMTKNWANFIFAGNRHIKRYVTERDAIFYKVDDDTKRKIDSHYKKRFFIYKDGWENRIEDIKKSMVDSARKYGAKLFIIDNLTAINLDCSENEKWGKQVEFVNWLIDFAQKYHVVVILVIHPKKIEAMRRLSKFDVAGLGSIVDLAHRLISLYRVTPKDKKGVKNMKGGWQTEPIKYDVMLDVLKDRMRGRENLEIGLYYDIPSRRFFTNQEEYEFQYSWDKESYNQRLPLPKQLKDQEPEPEIFGKVV